LEKENVTVFQNSQTVPATVSGIGSTEGIVMGCKEGTALQKEEEVEKGVYCFRLQLSH
jgi:hypothetical protein